jgi:hypothetical protein
MGPCIVLISEYTKPSGKYGYDFCQFLSIDIIGNNSQVQRSRRLREGIVEFPQFSGLEFPRKVDMKYKKIQILWWLLVSSVIFHAF